MYRYEYETIDVGGGFWLDNSKRMHRELIDTRAREGWRYAGYMPIQFSSRGSPTIIDLIFEREEADGAG